MDAKTEFDRIFGDVIMSDNDAAWYVFKAGWNAARAANDYENLQKLKQESSAWRKRKLNRGED
jgi:hypothetical protein